MSITQHPNDETLAALAAGALDRGRSIVLAAHVDMCSRCRAWTGSMEHIGGIMLADLPPATLAPDALSQLLGRIDRGDGALAMGGEPPLPPDLAMLPRSARPYPIGRWRWLGPGVHWRPLELPDAAGARVFLLKAAPGTRMPQHTHTGSELTLVLTGAFAHSGGRYGPGDLDEADENVEHQPIVAPGEDCISLVAMEGQLRLLGVVGRLLQPFVRL